MKTTTIYAIAAALAAGIALPSCLNDDVDTILIDPADPAGTGNGPGSGSGSGTNPGTPGHPLPYDLTFYLPDAVHPETGEWPRLLAESDGTDPANAWLEIDGHAAEVTFINPGDDPAVSPMKADIALLVDNSDSMEEEADALAAAIGTWTRGITASGIDARYAVVAHSETGTINGATDFGSADDLAAFFNYLSGTDRTAHFSGTGSDRLQREAALYPRLNTECCMLALRFGHDNLTFRDGAERVYISFTDEPNQPYGNEEYSVNWLTGNWYAAMGTVHTVYSAAESAVYEPAISEPARMLSDRTGGTTTYTDERLSDFDLSGYTVTRALAHPYVARIADVSPYDDGKIHTVVITVRSADGKINTSKTLRTRF